MKTPNSIQAGRVFNQQDSTDEVEIIRSLHAIALRLRVIAKNRDWKVRMFLHMAARIVFDCSAALMDEYHRRAKEVTTPNPSESESC
jgi:hypothetical protein